MIRHKVVPVLRHRFKFCVALFSIALLGGCTHAVKVPLLPVTLPALGGEAPPSRDLVMQQLKSKTPCCHAWSDLPFRNALPAEPRAFTIDKFSPVAILDGEPTHFLTYELPKYEKPYRVVFQTQPSARNLGSSFLLAPTVTLLDANHEPISRTDVPLCVYINWRPSMSGGFGAVTVDNPAAQFLVVTTSKKQLAATTYWAQSPTSFSSVNVPSASAFASIKPATPVTSGSFKVPHGPEGTLTLGKITPAYADAVDNGLCGKPAKGSGLLPELKRSFQNR